MNSVFYVPASNMSDTRTKYAKVSRHLKFSNKSITFKVKTMNNGLALFIFFIACISGVQFKRLWKNNGPVWQLWFFGTSSAIGLLLVGLMPIHGGE